MAQTQPQKSSSIRIGSGVLKVGGTNFGLLDNARLELAYNIINIRAQNGYLPPKKSIDQVQFTAELYEIHLPNIEVIDKHGVIANTASSPVAVTGEALGTGWTVGQPIKLANKNGANTIVTSIVIDEDGSPLTDGTDYETYVADGTNGELWYTYIVPLTASTGVLDADYSYTPSASKTITWSDVVKLIETYEVIFENTDADGKVFRLTIPKAYNGGNIELAYTADDAVDEAMKIPVTFTALPDDSNEMLKIYDEVSLT